MEQILMTIKNNLPLFLGLTGTFLSILALLLQWIKYKNDQSIITIKVTNGFFTGCIDSGIKIFIEAINRGSKPIKLISAGVRLSNKQNLLILHPTVIKFPTELNGFDSCSVDIDKTYLANYVITNNVRIKFVWFKDAIGRLYKAKFPIKFLNCNEN